MKTGIKPKIENEKNLIEVLQSKTLIEKKWIPP